MGCSRCLKLGCKGATARHEQFYQLPLSLYGGNKDRFMGQWCVCCLASVFEKLKSDDKNFISLLKSKPGVWIERPEGDNHGFSTAVQEAGVGVFYEDLNKPVTKPESDDTGHGKWGWPFAYDERPTPKTHYIPPEAKDILNAAQFLAADRKAYEN